MTTMSFTKATQPPLPIPDGWTLHEGRGFHKDAPHHHTSWAVFASKAVESLEGVVRTVHLLSDHAQVYLESGEVVECSVATARQLARGQGVRFDVRRLSCEPLSGVAVGRSFLQARS